MNNEIRWATLVLFLFHSANQQFYDNKKLDFGFSCHRLWSSFLHSFSSNFIISIFPRSSHLGTPSGKRRRRRRRRVVLSHSDFIRSVYLILFVWNEMEKGKAEHSLPVLRELLPYNKAICCKINFLCHFITLLQIFTFPFITLLFSHSLSLSLDVTSLLYPVRF